MEDGCQRRRNRDVDLVGVDGDGDPRFLREPPDYLLCAVDLFGCADRDMPRSRGFAADIEKISAFLDHAESLRNGRVTIVAKTVATERIRRDVDDPHHVGAAAPLEPVASDLGDHDAQYDTPP